MCRMLFSLFVIWFLPGCTQQSGTSSFLPSAEAHRSCDTELGPDGSVEVTSVGGLDYYSSGLQSEWSVGLVHLFGPPANEANIIVLNLEGGPGGDPRAANVKKRLDRLFSSAPQMPAVFGVSYSGSSDQPYREKLAQFGLKALECDSILLSKLVEALKHEHQSEIVVMANSYSGLLAMRAFRNDGVDKLILFAPWVNYIDSKSVRDLGFSVILDGELLDVRDSAFRREYKNFFQTYFRIDEDVASDEGREWMKQVREEFGRSEKLASVLVIQGEFENRYDLDVATSYFEEIGVGCNHILPKMLHEGVAGNRVASELVRDFLWGNGCAS
jgi:hypothetical protein